MAGTLYDERKAYAPLQLFEYDHDPGHYCLMLSDRFMVEVSEPFEAAGYEGGGYDWNGVAMQAGREADVHTRFRTDPEAGTFVAYGTDLEALQILGAALKVAFDDPKRLAALIAAADPNDFD